MDLAVLAARSTMPQAGGRRPGALAARWAAPIWVSRHWTAEEAADTVLARSYFGHGFFGIETAARGYFGRALGELSAPETAMLAGLLQAPQRSSPWCHPDRAWQRTEWVLARLRPGEAGSPRLRPSPAGACPPLAQALAEPGSPAPDPRPLVGEAAGANRPSTRALATATAP